ncbi:hypothetical protein [Lederbergia citrea]|nr:hypothetical protein [Lederbergia citrea]MBS4204844.1 hypothetical protein [Lederbergia citrea]
MLKKLLTLFKGSNRDYDTPRYYEEYDELDDELDEDFEEEEDVYYL